jgi:hypothetical protein
MCIFTTLPATSVVTVLKSTPMVDTWMSLYRSSCEGAIVTAAASGAQRRRQQEMDGMATARARTTKRVVRQLLPTLVSPTNTTLNVKSLRAAHHQRASGARRRVLTSRHWARC